MRLLLLLLILLPGCAGLVRLPAPPAEVVPGLPVTGIANVETNKGGRVQGFFVPNAADANKGTPGAKPATPPTN